jgi:hypothetical protein
MAHYYVGQAAHGSTPERVESLQTWLAERGPPGTLGSSRCAPKTLALAVPANSCRRSC